MRIKSITVRSIGMIVLIMMLVILDGAFTKPMTEAGAKSRIRLSATVRKHFYLGCADRLVLKGVGKHRIVRWVSSNPTVVRIRHSSNRKRNRIWYTVLRPGKATISAVYKKKRYKCQITIVSQPSDDIDSYPGYENEEDDTGAGSESSSIGSEGGGTEDVLPTEQEETAVCAYEQVIQDFIENTLPYCASEYEIVDRICSFISSEFSYEAYQSSWMKMLEAGAGDCMASRCAVMMISRRCGLRSAAVFGLENHGMTVVRADGHIYLTVTGTDEPIPRSYSITELNDEDFRRICSSCHIDTDYFFG